MSYTLTAILEQIRDLIGDTSVVSPDFDDATLTGFINRAIEDISQHFPRQMTYTIGATAGQHEYDLILSHLQVISVEFPTGSNPPTFLQHRPYTDAAFWRSSKYYDFIQPGDGSSLNPPRIILSANPADDQVATIEILAEHGFLTVGSDTTTIPDRFIHLIGLFVRWKCWQRLASEEAADPDPQHLLSTTQELNATRAEDAYRRSLAAAQATTLSTSPAPWPMDHHDRIY